MSQRRIELQRKLECMLGTRNVYFQPPTGTKLQYPCFVYKLDNVYDIHANDKQYKRLVAYSLTYITKDPEDPMCGRIDDLMYTSLSTMFISDNLYHFVYRIYY